MLAHLEAMMAATDIGEVWALHLERMERYGFTRLLYGFTRFRTSACFGEPADLLILSNHTEDYLNSFIHSGLYKKAPLISVSAETVGPLSWSEAHRMAVEGQLTDDEMDVMEFNRKHGVVAGYSISFHDGSVRAKGAISLCAAPDMNQEKVDQLWDAKGREILLLNNIAHMRITTLPFVGSRRSLTSRQREVLEWVGDGKTTQDIATIMGVTVATVEKHLRLAREALDVSTTAQAMLKAVLQNQIFIISPPPPVVWISRGRRKPPSMLR